MKVYMCDQGTPEWLDLRSGVATASEFNNILTPKRCELSAGWKAYAAMLISEIFTGGPDPWRFEGQTADMRRGVEFEPEAREVFAFTLGEEIKQVGFCLHDNGRWGASPDGLMVTRGWELKCPAPKTQIRWVYDNVLPDDHKNQCHGGMIVTGYDEWVFGAYCAGCPSLIVEVKRDDYTRMLEEALLSFNEKFDKMLAVIQEKRLEAIDTKIAMKGSDQLDDSHRALVPPSGQAIDLDPFGPGPYEPQLF
jgi:hypothetical protein